MMEKKHLFDDPANVKRLLRAIYVICAVLVGLDLLFLRHGMHEWESMIGFYAIYGFVGCSALVLVAREMRKFLMRDEEYYDDD
ncbi:MAG: hypothetical protein VCD50_15955 [Alphaproteobacteria bacterium]|jgi:hypothetical protein